MQAIFECPKCGAHHLEYQWKGNAFCECPSCQQLSYREELDFMNKLSASRFWPYFMADNEIKEKYPEWGKW